MLMYFVLNIVEELDEMNIFLEKYKLLQKRDSIETKEMP